MRTDASTIRLVACFLAAKAAAGNNEFPKYTNCPGTHGSLGQTINFTDSAYYPGVMYVSTINTTGTISWKVEAENRTVTAVWLRRYNDTDLVGHGNRVESSGTRLGGGSSGGGGGLNMGKRDSTGNYTFDCMANFSYSFP
jgi:uncharacterized membrane protein YgcG